MVHTCEGYFSHQVEAEKWGFERRFDVVDDSREFYPIESFSTLKEARQALDILRAARPDCTFEIRL